MTVAYDGRAYHGFAVQESVRTVGGDLTACIGEFLRHRVELTCAGRTDAGVHAWGQVVSFDAAAEGFDPAGLQRSLNRRLGPAVAVRSLAVAGADFDARRSALSRRYHYTVLNRPVPDPFMAATSWHVEPPLDLHAMQTAGDPLIGEHDFSSFCRAPRQDPPASLVRRVHDVRWCELGDGVLRLEIEASSFCHQMVRSLVATMVDMGRGRRRPGDMTALLRARSREGLSGPAPAHGLCLWEVRYYY